MMRGEWQLKKSLCLMTRRLRFACDDIFLLAFYALDLGSLWNCWCEEGNLNLSTTHLWWKHFKFEIVFFSVFKTCISSQQLGSKSLLDSCYNFLLHWFWTWMKWWWLHIVQYNDADEDYKMAMMMTLVPANQAYFSLPNIFKEFPVLRKINIVT